MKRSRKLKYRHARTICSPRWTAEAWLRSCGISTPDGLAVPIIGNHVIVIPSLIKTGSHSIAVIDRPVTAVQISYPLSIFEDVCWLYKLISFVRLLRSSRWHILNFRYKQKKERRINHFRLLVNKLRYISSLMKRARVRAHRPVHCHHYYVHQLTEVLIVYQFFRTL